MQFSQTILSLLTLWLGLTLIVAPIQALNRGAETDTRAVFSPGTATSSSKRLVAGKSLLFNLDRHGCVLPGEVLKLTGEQLMDLSKYRLVLRAEKQFIALKLLSISKQQILIQIPRDTTLKPGQQYSLVLLAAEGADVSQNTGMSLRLCPSIAKHHLLPVQEAHESGEILVLVHSGLVDQIIKEGSKLGYLLLRRHQLNSINQTLLVLGGSDRNLNKALKKLRATFADAAIDFNHHFYTSGGSPQLHAAAQMHWPEQAECSPRSTIKVSVGMLDGDIDMTHPALMAKNIKTRNFLLPSQKPDQDHATAIAVLLVGSQPDHGFQGLVPFINLKAANVVQVRGQDSVATAEAIARAMDWFIKQQVQLVNVSLTSPNVNKVTNTLFAQAINKGLIIFAAAGNDGNRQKSAYPAALPGVITITAIDARGEILASANQGDYIDFAAPGVDIWTASKTHSGQYRSGTSLAVPHAVSIAALYLSQQPGYSRDRLFETLRFNAVDLGSRGFDTRYGWGQVQVNQQMCHH
ncbi:S8 family serine peptidase [Methylophaga sp. OBS4]|uniref:S8 family serine peptidase n=1 Tax=Methylophaga sp. OBS4 TaxID=2991935 RepID=UPI00224CC2B0|nr:S8 family serine peptidase [Methylophaga sp. OBS4]MCX4187503.1 S8 family serine peptidase [Methylophaga sp. OBS4]